MSVPQSSCHERGGNAKGMGSLHCADDGLPSSFKIKKMENQKPECSSTGGTRRGFTDLIDVKRKSTSAGL